MLLVLLRRAPKSILKLPVLQRMRPKQTKTSRKSNSISHLMRLQRLVLSWVKGVFDRQTPDVEVFADVCNHIDHKTTINTNTESKTAENISHHVWATTQNARPSKYIFSKLLLQEWAQCVKSSGKNRQRKDVEVWIRALCEMRDNDKANLVGKRGPNEKHEWDKMLRANFGAEITPGRNHHPGQEEWCKTSKRREDTTALCTASANDILRTIPSQQGLASSSSVFRANIQNNIRCGAS